MGKRGRRELFLAAVFVLAVGLVVAGCGGGGGLTPEEIQQSIDQGNASLDTGMDSFTTATGQGATFGEAFSGSQGDLETANDAFEEALGSDPDNQQANLGAALTGLVLLLGDTNGEFGVEEIVGGPGPGVMGRGWRPGRLISRLAHRQGEPTITDLQNHLDTVVIPRLEEILTRLQNVTDESLEVQVPPEPDPENPDDYVILDFGDVLLLRAIVNEVLSIVHSAVVYDLDPGTFYDGGPTPPQLDVNLDGILTPEELLAPDPFLTLRANGVAHSQAARTTAYDAMTDLISAIEFMLAEYEAGTQDHEVIPVGTGPEEADPADLANLHNLALLLARILNEETWFNPSVEIDPGAPDVEIHVDVPAFANNPPADLRDLIPDLTYVEDPLVPGEYVITPGALPDPTFAGLFPDGLPIAAVMAMLR